MYQNFRGLQALVGLTRVQFQSFELLPSYECGARGVL